MQDDAIPGPEPEAQGHAPRREPNPRLMGPGRTVWVSSALALTDPGPAASGLVIQDERGQALLHRAQYLGQASRGEAAARALLGALYLCLDNQLLSPTLRIEDAELAAALRGDARPPDDAARLWDQIVEARARLGSHTVEAIRGTNPAHVVALAPLVEWLPERTRRAEGLAVQQRDDGSYEVRSARGEGQTYRVTLGTDRETPLACECADFQYRNIPCKHLLAAASSAGGAEQVFHHPTSPESLESGRAA
ncbi:MAG: SWIM zinc finger family protein [Chloroflexi bacterium]|nr:SWIM zinc finger family protein [Chloroflexota bacterium]